MKLNVLGLDPSMSNLGIAAGVFDTATGKLEIRQVLTCSPDIKSNKQTRQNSIDLEKARVLYRALMEALTGAHLVCVEVPHGSQSARAMASYGICIGLLATVTKPLLQVTAQEVKRVVGLPKPSKADMIAWAMRTHPEAPLATYNGKINAAKAEHQADAIAAIHAAMRLDEFKLFTTKALL